MKKIITLFILIQSFAFAQTSKIDTLTSKTLDEVLLTTKSNLKIINTARSVEALDINTLKANGSNTLHQSLNTISGVYMVDMGNEQHAMSIRLPINYSPLYNYLENGIPLRPVGIFNNNELLELNRFSIKKIEMVKGTFSGSYGAQSIGASVNFIQNNFESSANEISLQSNGFGQFEAVAQYKNAINKTTNFVVNANNSQRIIDDSFHFNYQKQSVSVRVEKKLSSSKQLIFQSNIINYNGDQRNGYNDAQFNNKQYASNDRFSDRKTLAIRNTIEFTNNLNNNNNYNLTFFNRIINEEQNPFYLITWTPPYNGRITNDKFVSYGVNFNYNNTSKNGKLKFNASAYFDATPNNTYTSKLIWVQKNANFVNVSFTNTDSLVTNYTANLFNTALSSSLCYLPNNNWVITAAARFDNLSYKFNNHLSKSNTESGTLSGNKSVSAINPEFSVLYKISNNQSVYAQYSTGFLPPTLSNYFRDVDSTPNLKNAVYYNSEIGYKFFTKHFQLQLSAYNMIGVNEFISDVNANGIITVTNAGKTNHSGIELKTSYTKNNFEINFNGSFSKHTYTNFQRVGWGGGITKYDGNTMIAAPSFTHYANIGYTFGKENNMKILFEWNKVGPYKIDYENKFEYGGYNLFNLKSTFKCNKFFINVGINNLFDINYATVADGTYGFNNYYPGIKRTLQIGCSYRF